ncbi:hypothetical protein BJ322DRAFT_81462 [Thelephora terrestris]|uniref:Uncharacterized protein n=1 Tax=Thelephora terrestris TaxID=56493 RepID=A0A9P6HRD9_9AGAM|nr:hypothetical protein BJ322DRAFT_81462 [Thelephora terrestris]
MRLSRPCSQIRCANPDYTALRLACCLSFVSCASTSYIRVCSHAIMDLALQSPLTSLRVCVLPRAEECTPSIHSIHALGTILFTLGLRYRPKISPLRNASCAKFQRSPSVMVLFGIDLPWLLPLGFTLSRKLASFISGYSVTSFGAVTLLKFLSDSATHFTILHDALLASWCFPCCPRSVLRVSIAGFELSALGGRVSPIWRIATGSLLRSAMHARVFWIICARLFCGIPCGKATGADRGRPLEFWIICAGFAVQILYVSR